ncbi:hypothetical protein E2493_04420 [Sphingomonas parva]|uniref:Uncharacterized protein n=1 Tax=Sphingomonas parva TaxID=2555898 RepID=A0A4Y8ZTU1_9SPHN|nr:hypothetical protein [Sphingomonas parva]TFI59443.1 hypothetical protein E2493_04420 [Sphingomonas parva]
MRLYAFRYGQRDNARTEELYFRDDRSALDYAMPAAAGGGVEIWQDETLLVCMEKWGDAA